MESSIAASVGIISTIILMYRPDNVQCNRIPEGTFPAQYPRTLIKTLNRNNFIQNGVVALHQLYIGGKFKSCSSSFSMSILGVTMVCAHVAKTKRGALGGAMTTVTDVSCGLGTFGFLTNLGRLLLVLLGLSATVVFSSSLPLVLFSSSFPSVGPTGSWS